MAQVWDTYYHWLQSPYIDEATREELETLKSNEAEIRDRFYQSLAFGTGGMRGIIGAGTNRMNVYTVRKAAAGLARYLLATDSNVKQRGVVIAFDSRHKSHQFATEAGKVLAHNGINVHIFEAMRPTPLLSFAVRELGAAAGIMITASHNPPEYNGLKVYGPDGGQVVSEDADKITAEIEQISDALQVRLIDEQLALEQGLWHKIGREMDAKYMRRLKGISFESQQEKTLKIVYTPLHGTGVPIVPEVLKNHGFHYVSVVEEQSLSDPNFSTVTSPNPEEWSAFAKAVERGKQTNADLLLATDPDTDRVGAVVKDGTGEYVPLTGNQLGALLLHFILSRRQEAGTLPHDGVVLKTIVTSELGRVIAEHFGLTTVDTLTGFKYIAENIRRFEADGSHTFVFGYEESYGYLIGDFVRDKDAVQACLLTAEMAAYYKARGRTLHEQLYQLYDEFGFYRESLQSYTLTGKDGAERMARLMARFRQTKLEQVGGCSVRLVKDYRKGTVCDRRLRETYATDLPREDVLYYVLEDGSAFCIRPSGTEPKVKVYLMVKAHTEEIAEQKLTRLKNEVQTLIIP